MLGERLRSLRNKYKLRQEDLAKKIGIARTTYAMYEQEKRQPDYETLQQLADFFNVSTDYLLGRDSNENKISDDQLAAFSFRLKHGLKTADITIDEVADECGVSVEYINELLASPKKLPGIGTLYRLAEIIDVTPDYLGGFTDDPAGTSSKTPRPKDMKEFLEREEVMLDGKVLSEEDKETVSNVLAALFLDAKKRNRRKK